MSECSYCYSDEENNGRAEDSVERRRDGLSGDSADIGRVGSDAGQFGGGEWSGCSEEEETDGESECDGPADEEVTRWQAEGARFQVDSEDEFERDNGEFGRDDNAGREERSSELPESTGDYLGRSEQSAGPADYTSTPRTYGSQGNAFEREEVYFNDSARNIRYVKSDETKDDRLRAMFSSAFRGMPARRRLVHDIYEVVRSPGGHAMDRGKVQPKYSGAIFLIAYHDDHWHVIHDCSFSNSTCRCAFIVDLCTSGRAIGSVSGASSRSIRLGRRYSRRIVSTFEFSLEHWLNLAKYLENGSRSIHYMELAGRIWIPSREAGSVRFLEDIRHTEIGVVEARRVPKHVSDFINCGPQIANGAEAAQSSGLGNSQTAWQQTGGKGDQLIRFLWERPSAPISHIFNTSIWLKSKYKFYDLNSTFLKNCIRILHNQYNEMSIAEMYKHYVSIEPQHLIFNSSLGNITEYYYSVKSSIIVMENLLLYQFYDSAESVKEFLLTLLNVLDKRVPKKNSLFVLSPPNAGKNYFFDAVIHYCINFGQMGNFNRYCSFPMMECVDRRIILWNEPCIEPSALETLKMILGGDTVNAKVKYQGDAVITRTPVIILSNNDIFPHDAAFRSRMFTYQWRSCDKLKSYTKKPHPIALYHLFEKYNIL